MTWVVIGRLIGGIASLLSDSRHKGYFVHKDCPLLIHGEAQKHLLHTQGHDTEGIAAVVNMIVDLLLLHSSGSQESFYDLEKQLGKSFKSDKETSISSKLRKILKRTKNFKLRHVKTETDKLAKAIRILSERVKEVLKKNENINSYSSQPTDSSAISKADNIILSRLSDLQRTLANKDDGNGESIIALADRISGLERDQKSVPRDVRKILEIAGSFKEADLLKFFDQALNRQDSKIQKELKDVLAQVRDLVDELKFDPDKPKPSEIRTEENSKLIIELSKQTKVLLTEVRETLGKTKEILKRTEETLNRIAS
ncbi:hypothetical protein [Viola yellow mottle virus]|uniref:Uncharacterized protein n=1 Tax=Viola yellow mottle virus TaxID=2922803 RepID=A0A976QWX7_9VIRU|nr:hypothetical protein [Viola yellow mottle virus]